MTEQTKTPPEGGGYEIWVGEGAAMGSCLSPAQEDNERKKRRTALRRIMWLNATSMVLALLSLAVALS